MTRLLAGVPALLGLCVLIGLAAQRGAADLMAFGARHAVDQVGFASAQASQHAHDRLELAIALDRENPTHYEYLARWHEMHASHRDALRALRRAASLRPAWPYVWADIARVKLRLGEIDAEFNDAVENAARMGPWEREVQLGIAAVTMEAAERMSPQARRSALGLMGNALIRDERALVELALRRARLDVLCAIPGIAAHPAAMRCI